MATLRHASLGIAAFGVAGLALAACTPGKSSGTTSGPAATADTGGDALTAESTEHGRASLETFCAPDTVTSAPAGPSGLTVESAHYQLYAETSRAQAVEMGRLLEAAYAAFGAWFQATPSPHAGRLQVRYYADQAAWSAGLEADGIATPSEAGGYYAPSTRTAYLFEQPNPYYSHVLLVHEAAHQYHALSRAGRRALPFWYAEGQAEYLSRHDWDGRCLRLGVIPLLSWEDIPSRALAEAQVGIDVSAIVSGSVPASRPASWALFHYLATGAHREAFRAFRDAFDAAPIDPAAAFTNLVGDPTALARPLAAWLPSAAEPMKPVFTEWIPVGPRAVTADSPGYVSLAVLKERPAHFEARYDVSAAASGSPGVVLGYEDEKTYEVMVVSPDGALRTFTAAAGSTRWSDAGRAPPPPGGAGVIGVDFDGEWVTVTVNGVTSLRSLGALPPKAGLAVSDGRASFHDVAWR